MLRRLAGSKHNKTNMDFISTYARDHPTREDIAESFPDVDGATISRRQNLSPSGRNHQGPDTTPIGLPRRSALRYGPGEVEPQMQLGRMFRGVAVHDCSAREWHRAGCPGVKRMRLQEGLREAIVTITA